jgi:predicted CopG family antitoxin
MPREAVATDEPTVGPDDDGVTEAETTAVPKGRGAGRAEKKPPAVKPQKKDLGRARTVHLPDDVYERILVRAKRRKVTISEFMATLIRRHVPDHLGTQGGTADDAA